MEIQLGHFDKRMNSEVTFLGMVVQVTYSLGKH